MIASEEQARAFVAQRCDSEALERMESYVAALIAENDRQNLVSASSLKNLWLRHIADSAQLLDHVPRETSPWLDLGSGPGLPGLVLACMRPKMRITLVESRRKRAEWLKFVTASLGLQGVRVADQRVERLESFAAAVITARAFAPLPRLIALSERFSTASTTWVLPKGRSAAQELAELPANRRKLFHVEQSATDPQAGIIVGKLSI